MRFVRFQQGEEPPRFGWLHENKIGEIEGDLFGAYKRLKAEIPLNDVRLLAPSVPSKIICVGRNYVEHAKELGNEVPKIPLIFFKPPSSVIASGGTILLPPQSAQVEHEAELVIVVGKRGRNVTTESARDFVFGYTIGNDVTARDLQKTDGQWTRAKGFDTFCPVGPVVVTELDWRERDVVCRVNGSVRQNGNTRDMVFDVPVLLAYISQAMTLEPGDLVVTGTPEGVGPLVDGDALEVEVSGVGVLSLGVGDAK